MNGQCRICRRNDLSYYFTLEHRTEFDRESMLGMLTFLSGLEGEINDDLPQQICRICRGTLISAYEFKQLCIESDRYFRQQLEQTNQPSDFAMMTETIKTENIEVPDLESLLVLEQVKMEHDSPADGISALAQFEETSSASLPNVNDKSTVKMFFLFCCFSECGVNFRFEENLVEHANQKHGEIRQANAAARDKAEAFVCICCGRGFSNEIQLMEHRAAINLSLYKCGQCRFRSRSKLEFTRHRLNHLGRHACECGYKTNVLYSMRRHRNICLVVLAVQKNNIPELTNEEVISLGYKLQMNQPPMFSCCTSTCGAMFETQQELTKHMNRKHSSSLAENGKISTNFSFNCESCLLGFETQKGLQIHQEDMFGPAFQCDKCTTLLESRKAAIVHKRMPCSLKDLKCPCGFTTNRKYSLERHWINKVCSHAKNVPKPKKQKVPRKEKKKKILKKVSRDATFICDVCNVDQKTAKLLKMHKYHELTLALVKQTQHDAGEYKEGSEKKTYSCRWCHEVTDCTDHLRRCMVEFSKHESKDQTTANRCDQCQVVFETEQQLQEHIDGSTKCSPIGFRCQCCRSRWASAELRDEHMRAMHSSTTNQLKCSFCGLFLCNAFALRRHTDRIHLKIAP